MEFLVVILIVVLLARWIVMRDRLNRMDRQISQLTSRLAAFEFNTQFAPAQVAHEPLRQPAAAAPTPPPPTSNT